MLQAIFKVKYPHIETDTGLVIERASQVDHLLEKLDTKKWRQKIATKIGDNRELEHIFKGGPLSKTEVLIHPIKFDVNTGRLMPTGTVDQMKTEFFTSAGGRLSADRQATKDRRPPFRERGSDVEAMSSRLVKF